MKIEELKEIINSPAKSAYIKNYDNIVSLQESDNLVDSEGRKFTKVHVDNLRMLIGQIIEVFGEQWDLHVKTSHSNVMIIGIDIMFPIIDLRNSRGNRHKITDFLLRLNLKANMAGLIVITRIDGARSSVTLKEYSCGYVHSHVPRTSYGKAPEGPGFNKFCTGSGSINDYINSFANANSVENAERLVMQLYTIVNWESLEGAPHFRMDGITYNSSGSSNTVIRPLDVGEHTCRKFSDEVMNLIETGKLPVAGLKANIIDNKISIEVEEDFLRNVMGTSSLKDFVGVVHSNSVVTEKSFIEFIKSSGNSNPHNVKVPEIVTKTGYFFNGVELGLTISDYKPEEKKENKIEVEIIYKIPQQYVNKFKQTAERAIYEQQIYRIIAERYS